MNLDLLPPRTNHLYRGSLTSVWFLGLYGLLEIIPGLIHFLLPDGGAGVIAGLDLAHNEHTIIGVFAWMCALQIADGLGLTPPQTQTPNRRLSRPAQRFHGTCRTRAPRLRPRSCLRGLLSRGCHSAWWSGR